MNTIIYLFRQTDDDREALRETGERVPSPGDILEIGDTLFAVGFVHRKDARSGDRVYYAYLANIDGAVGRMLRASR